MKKEKELELTDLEGIKHPISDKGKKYVDAQERLRIELSISHSEWNKFVLPVLQLARESIEEQFKKEGRVELIKEIREAIKNMDWSNDAKNNVLELINCFERKELRK